MQSKCSGTAEISNSVVLDSAGFDSLIDITISSVGDLMCHSTQFNYARVANDSFNFLPCFQYMQPYFAKADLLLGNLETTLSGNGIPYSGYPFFNTPDDYAQAIGSAGFDFLVTANNHANDHGEKGILRTIQVLDSFGIAHTGTFVSPVDRDSIRIENIKGIKVAVLSYSFSTNGNPLTDGKPWLVNICDSLLVQKDIHNSREKGAEIVIVFYHFGNEYERLPSDYQKGFVNYAIESGADIILGSHPHVLQPVDFFKTINAKLDTGFVAWSMGNFISNQKDEFTTEGILLNMHLEKNLHSGKIILKKVDYVPTWVYRGTSEEMKLHIVFPVFSGNDSMLPDFIVKDFAKDLNIANLHTADIINTYTDRVREAGQ